MSIPYPKEFRADVVAVACRGEQSRAQVARAFGISESCLARWLRIADRDDGLEPTNPGRTPAAVDETEVRELRRRNKQLEQENEILRRATLRARRPTSPGTPSQNDVPAGPRPGR